MLLFSPSLPRKSAWLRPRRIITGHVIGAFPLVSPPAEEVGGRICLLSERERTLPVLQFQNCDFAAVAAAMITNGPAGSAFWARTFVRYVAIESADVNRECPEQAPPITSRRGRLFNYTEYVAIVAPVWRGEPHGFITLEGTLSSSRYPLHTACRKWLQCLLLVFLLPHPVSKCD